MELSNSHRPKIAIIDPNTPAALGLKFMLQDVVPVMEAYTFGSFTELMANSPELYYHYFVALLVQLRHQAVDDSGQRHPHARQQPRPAV